MVVENYIEQFVTSNNMSCATDVRVRSFVENNKNIFRHFYYGGGSVAVKNDGVNAVEQYGIEKYFKMSTTVSKSV